MIDRLFAHYFPATLFLLLRHRAARAQTGNRVTQAGAGRSGLVPRLSSAAPPAGCGRDRKGGGAWKGGDSGHVVLEERAHRILRGLRALIAEEPVHGNPEPFSFGFWLGIFLFESFNQVKQSFVLKVFFRETLLAG